MKCLYVLRNFPLSSNFSGGASRHLAQYLALHRLGLDLFVLRFLSNDVKEDVLKHEAKNEEITSEIHGKATWWQDITYDPASPISGWFELIRKVIFDPIYLFHPEMTELAPFLLQAIKSNDPDFIWAESAYISAIIVKANIDLPWVYSHHDFEFRVRELRARKSKHTFYLSGMVYRQGRKYAEKKMLPKATAILTGSQTEGEELAKLGGSNIYLAPTTYDPVDISISETRNTSQPQIFHLGSLVTTANYLGMMSYLEKVVPQLDRLLADSGRKMPTLQIIGHTYGAKPKLLKKLNSYNAILLGHVDDLGSKLNPYDIVIIPYEHNTGMRTKLSLLFNYAQVVIATESSVAGSPEVKPGENCIVLSGLGGFAEALIELSDNADLREKIGRQARETFESEFMLENQIPIYEQIVSHMR